MGVVELKTHETHGQYRQVATAKKLRWTVTYPSSSSESNEKEGLENPLRVVVHEL